MVINHLIFSLKLYAELSNGIYRNVKNTATYSLKLFRKSVYHDNFLRL